MNLNDYDEVYGNGYYPNGTTRFESPVDDARYSLGKTCPTCGELIYDTSDHCKSHALALANMKRQGHTIYRFWCHRIAQLWEQATDQDAATELADQALDALNDGGFSEVVRLIREMKKL